MCNYLFGSYDLSFTHHKALPTRLFLRPVRAGSSLTEGMANLQAWYSVRTRCSTGPQY